MTSYEAAELLRNVLRMFKITETLITSGGVKIQCRRHQTKTVIDVLNGLSATIDYVEITLIIVAKDGWILRPTLVRKEGRPISISYGAWKNSKPYV